ncbi:MAG: secondary thiamine-phosphate synthase enzyme YjbQ [Euryarchaeota archaeon]|nr:secondary thiamine-phosphate synthase enzyme YjbQ [Euryarchaeota archaeon]
MYVNFVPRPEGLIPPKTLQSLIIKSESRDMDIQTTDHTQLIDITTSLDEEIADTGIETGVLIAYTPHTTTAIIINENEAGLKEDILKLIDTMVPAAKYAHDRIDNNARSHLQAVILGNSACIPIENGRLALGTWQSVFFVELDGPRRRRLTVRIIDTIK